MGRNEALAKIDTYFHDGMFEAELARRVAYRTESVRPDSGPALTAYLDEDLIP